MSESKFPKDAREAARRRCSLNTPMRNLDVVRLALDELDRLAAENAELRKQVAERDEALEFAASRCLRLIRSQLVGEPVAYSYCCYWAGERKHGPQFGAMLSAIQDAKAKGGGQ